MSAEVTTLRLLIRELLVERDPPAGTGRKPKGSGRRLYTDEDPSDTVSVRFRTRADVMRTLRKQSFRRKSHARRSQIINLIHQRLVVAVSRARDPSTRRRLRRALDYIEARRARSKEITRERSR
jgi:hypothetical protein